MRARASEILLTVCFVAVSEKQMSWPRAMLYSSKLASDYHVQVQWVDVAEHLGSRRVPL